MPIKWEDLVAGGAGAIDEALYGLPEYALKNLGARKQVEDYIKKNEKAYRTGETIGTIGSMFIPVPGAALLKGGSAAAKGLKGLDTAADTVRLAQAAAKAKKASSIGNLALKGALSGGAESGIRGITSEKTPSEILRDIQTGTMFGGAGGAAGGLLSKGLKSIGGKAVTYADEAGKIRKQYMEGAAGLTGRDTKQILKEYAGQGAKGLGKFAKSEDALSQVDRVIKEGELYKVGGDDKYFGMVSKHWDDMNKAADSVLGKDVPGGTLFNAALERGAGDLAELKGAQGEKVKTMLGTLAAEGDNYEGIHGFKKYLDDVYKDTFSDVIYPKSSDKQAARDAVGIIRRNIDDIVADAAEQAGLDPKIIAERKKNYIFDRALGESFARQVMKPKTIGAGSPTAIRTLTQGVLGAGLGYASGDPEGTAMDKLKRVGTGVALGMGSDVIGGMLGKAAGATATRALAGSDNLVAGLQKLAPGIENIAGKIAPEIGAAIGGQAGSVIARKAIEAAAPETPKEAEAAETAAVSDDEPKYMSRVMSKMQEFAIANGIDPESQDFQDFAGEMYSATAGFQPEKIGMILYSDPGERAAYLKALEVSRGLKETMPAATGKMRFGSTDEEKIQREAAVNQLAALVSDAAKDKGAGTEAKASIKKILSSGKSPEEKAELVKATLMAYGVDLDELESMGVV